MLTPIRVVVDKAPRLLRDIVERTIALQADMELVIVDPNDPGTLARRRADVVIVAPESAGRVPDALIDNPRLKVLVLTNEGRSAHVVELCEHPVADVSPQGLVNAIRAAVKEGATWK